MDEARRPPIGLPHNQIVLLLLLAMVPRNEAISPSWPVIPFRRTLAFEYRCKPRFFWSSWLEASRPTGPIPGDRARWLDRQSVWRLESDVGRDTPWPMPRRVLCGGYTTPRRQLGQSLQTDSVLLLLLSRTRACVWGRVCVCLCRFPLAAYCCDALPVRPIELPIDTILNLLFLGLTTF